MRAVDLIRKKRDGGEHALDEIQFLVSGYTAGDIPDYQLAAWLMAVVWRGMTERETAGLVAAMMLSPRSLDLSHLPARKVDKHSTGGVGDKTSLVVAPIAAAAGLIVPMISGRALGHTGGTLDKLESIPGFNPRLSLDEFRAALEDTGCAMVGQTEEIAPADRKLYALRDATATIESPYLICGSIMSKKLSESIDALVLDVKTGSGAFMKTEAEAASLAELMVETGRRVGKRVVALVTDMDQPLGRAVGNSLEVIEAFDVLRGGGPGDLRDLCLELSAWMLHLGEAAATVDAGRKLAAEILDSGRALAKFRQIIRRQGGDDSVAERYDLLPRAAHQRDVPSPASGRVAAIECANIGLASVWLGAGREKKEDAVDPAAGLIVCKKLGDAVRQGEPLVTLHYNAAARVEAAEELVRASYRIEPAASAAPRPLVRRVIGP
ncbi:MAG TPA: thymidine phosphorylase [Candidatus Acidoferrales bacterium]|nr:thymidine phosphorylase [Candidatus Acidoferrales bacterium]